MIIFSVKIQIRLFLLNFKHCVRILIPHFLQFLFVFFWSSSFTLLVLQETERRVAALLTWLTLLLRRWSRYCSSALVAFLLQPSRLLLLLSTTLKYLGRRRAQKTRPKTNKDKFTRKVDFRGITYLESTFWSFFHLCM